MINLKDMGPTGRQGHMLYFLTDVISKFINIVIYDLSLSVAFSYKLHCSWNSISREESMS